MQEFIDYLNNGIIRRLKELYKVNNYTPKDEEILNWVIRDLFFLKKKPLNDDIISHSYENMRNHEEKKRLGEFYTPYEVVEYILDSVEYSDSKEIENKKLVDISCGSGSFIIQAVRRLVKKWLMIYGKDISKLTKFEAERIISSIKENIYGIDINRTACILCQINIHFELFDILRVIQKTNPQYQLPLFNIINDDSITLDTKIKYNYVVGNPPYLFIRDIPINQRKIIENSNLETNNGQYDYYQIFMELGLKLLNKGGLFGYIVPDSLLALSHRTIIRKFIYNTSKIKEIYYTGPKFDDPIVSNIIIILEKENNAEKRKKNQIKIKISNQPERFIPQVIIEKWGYKFLIHLNSKDALILKNLNSNFPKLRDLDTKFGIKCKLSRGVELTKAGEIIFCKNCNKYFPIPKKSLICIECKTPLDKNNIERIIVDSVTAQLMKYKFKLYLYAMQRYQKIDYKYIDTSKIGINYKEFSNYEDRIIIRQISQNCRICATYDKNLSLTSQSFYNLKIENSPIHEFNNYYLLGLINSTLLSYYFIKSFGTYKRLFPRILIEKIKELPIIVPTSYKERENAKKIMERVKLNLKEEKEVEHIQNQLDLLVFELYQISEDNQKYIKNYINSLISKS